MMSHIGRIGTKAVPFYVQADAKLANRHLSNSYCASSYLPIPPARLLQIFLPEMHGIPLRPIH